MINPETDCSKLCPYADEPNFIELNANCRGTRIRLDKWSFAQQNGVIVGELAAKACGSSLGPDTDYPTISIQDWADTPLIPSQLNALYDEGLLPDQLLE